MAVLAQEEVLLLEVAPNTVACVGEMVGQCIQVRGPGEEEWRIFYDPIEGFERKDGVAYTIEVVRTTVPNPPADGSSYAYRLIRIISEQGGQS
jgi:hypothetical protein